MDLLCYVQDGWEPRLRPASPKRDWMDSTRDSHAYRCLPLNIANAHGWEILSPCGFEASWDGGADADSVQIWLDEGTQPHHAPVSLFGHGTITFHIQGVFRTPEGWNMWVGGSPNAAKDGIAPLGGVVETDWSPYTFTMNWRFTRPGQRIRFEENEPFCFIFPVQRNVLEQVKPRLVPMAEAPELQGQFEAWSKSRNAFHEEMRASPPDALSETWQKFYYRGTNPDGSAGAGDHKSKLRLPEFRAADGKRLKLPDGGRCPVQHAGRVQPHPSEPDREQAVALAKREWLLETMERQRSLSPKARSIHRWIGIGRQAFLDDYYAPGRPVLLVDEMKEWPALERWTPDYLREKVGPAPIEFQGGRSANPRFEIDKQAHRCVMPFDRFIDRIAGTRSNDAYVTAFNSDHNAAALAPLAEDLGFLDTFLDRSGARPDGMPWIGPAGTFTPLHHDLTNNLLAQMVGRKRVVLAPPSETPRLYNRHHVFSDVGDISDGRHDPASFPIAGRARLFDLILEPGEILFIPVGWWHQVTALDFSVSVTYTNFLWPNHHDEGFPAD